MRKDINSMAPRKYNAKYPLDKLSHRVAMQKNLAKYDVSKFAKSARSTAAKAIRTARPTVHTATKVSRGISLGMGAVIGAAAYGAHRISKASKAANKEIESQHSPARNAAHRAQILAIRKQGERKRAAKTLRKKLVSKKVSQFSSRTSMPKKATLIKK